MYCKVQVVKIHVWVKTKVHLPDFNCLLSLPTFICLPLPAFKHTLMFTAFEFADNLKYFRQFVVTFLHTARFKLELPRFEPSLIYDKSSAGGSIKKHQIFLLCLIDGNVLISDFFSYMYIHFEEALCAG